MTSLVPADYALNHHTTMVEAFLPFYGVDEIYASVIDADYTATTYQVTCPNEYDDENDEDGYYYTENPCNRPGGQKIIYGPNTFSLAYSNDDTVYATGIMSQNLDCKLYPRKDGLSCHVKQIYSDEDSGETTIESTYSTRGLLYQYMAELTVTAGVDKLTSLDDTPLTESMTPEPSSTGTDYDWPTLTGQSLLTYVTVTPTPSASNSHGIKTSAAASGSNSPATTAVATKTDSGAGAVAARAGVVAGVAALLGGAMMFL